MSEREIKLAVIENADTIAKILAKNQSHIEIHKVNSNTIKIFDVKKKSIQ